MAKRLYIFVYFIILFCFFVLPIRAFAESGFYQRCEPSTDCTLGEFIFADDGHTPITTDNFCQITITVPSTPAVTNTFDMSHGSDGWYSYVFNSASPEGLYRSIICCDTGANKRCLDKTFVLGTSFDSLPAKIWSYTGRTLDSFGTLVSDIWSNATRTLTSRQIATNEYIAGVTSATPVTQVASEQQVTEIRDSQQKQWTVYLSDFGQILTGNTYRAKLWVLNYESVPTDPYAFPTVTVYDASRNKVVENVVMTKLSAGIYEYTYTVPGTAVQGVWETVASTEVESGKTLQNNDYWEVEGSPAQVKINSISDNTIPSISANVILTNEGLSGYEYKYEWCVVSSESNACGGGDDVSYSSASKYINAGQNWTTDLTATVPNTGAYWFKVVVYYGTEKSGASQSFNAVAAGATCGDKVCNGSETCTTCPGDCGVCSGGGGGGGGGGITTPIVPAPTTIEALWNYITQILARLINIETNTASLNSRMVALETKLSELNSKPIQPLTTAVPQVAKQTVIVRQPISTVPASRAKIRLEGK